VLSVVRSLARFVPPASVMESSFGVVLDFESTNASPIDAGPRRSYGGSETPRLAGQCPRTAKCHRARCNHDNGTRPGAANERACDTECRFGSPRTLEDAERAHITKTLHETNWVDGGRGGAAAKLGLARTTLIAMMHRLRICRET
jgi:DNA-binding NtrC family response regulator